MTDTTQTPNSKVSTEGVHGIFTTSKSTVTVFLSAHINILLNSIISQSLKSNCQKHSHCTFASRKNGSIPTEGGCQGFFPSYLLDH